MKTLVKACFLLSIAMLTQIEVHAGCNDVVACNYSNSDTDDLDCLYSGDSCDDGDETTVNDVYQSGCSCQGELAGCMDSSALNYNASAVIDDGSCIIPVCSDAAGQWNYCYEINESGIIATFLEASAGDGVIIEFNSGSLEAGWDTITIFDGPNENSAVLFEGFGELTGLVFQSTGAALCIQIDSDGSVSCGSGAQTAMNANVYCATEVVPGCDDASACNFDSAAEFNNGSCLFPTDSCDDNDETTLNDSYQADCSCQGELAGCMDSSADNYNADALVDSGSCLYNDFCITAQTVSCGETVAGSTLNASSGDEFGFSDCGPAIEGPGVWYVMTGTGEELTAETCDDPNFYDSRIHVFSGSCENFICEGGNDDACGLQSSVTWYADSGVDYYIHVSGWNGGIGNFEINFTCSPAECTPAANDQCTDALTLTDGLITSGSNVCSYSNDTQPSCDPFASINGVWYVWNSGANDAAVIDLSPAVNPIDSAAVDPAVAMFGGSCGSFVELYCEDLALPVSGEGVVVLAPATDYYFLVWTDTDLKEGEFDLTVTGGIAGCTELGACNYDPSAEIDNGSCDLSCIGCTQPCSINYNSTATFDDGSCLSCDCEGENGEFTYCYLNDQTVTFQFAGINPANPAAIYFESGEVEEGWDFINIYDGPDTTYPIIAEDITGDLTGLSFESSQNEGILTIEIISDGNVSCQSGFQEEIVIQTICSAQVETWCGICWNDVPPPYYFDCAGILNGTDWTCCDPNPGCLDPAACNYDECAIWDDGSCCYDNCATITITDTFGDGGGSVTIFDDDGLTVLANVSLADGFEISETFCIPSGCATIVPTSDNFPDETGITIEDQNGLMFELSPGSEFQPSVIDFGFTGECKIPGCPNPDALNYNGDQLCDCNGDVGGFDEGCCIYPIPNNECSGAIPLTSGVEEAWNTIGEGNTGSTNSGYNCSPTLLNDAWFSFTPPCSMEVTISSSSLQGGELGVWEGDCSGGNLTEVACAPNDGFQTLELEVILEEGVTYYIQTGSNSTYAVTSTGTIVLTEGACRGCIYPFAANYDPTAVIDDGSCIEGESSCPSDITGDGLISASDLTALLAAFGTYCD